MTKHFIPERDHRFTHRMCCQCHGVWRHDATVPPACPHPPCPGCLWGRSRVAPPFDPRRKAPKDWKCHCGTVHDVGMIVWGMVGSCCDEPWLEDIYDDEGRDYFLGHAGEMTFGRDLTKDEDLVGIQKWLLIFEEVWEENVEALNWMCVDGDSMWVRERELSVRDLVKESANRRGGQSTGMRDHRDLTQDPDEDLALSSGGPHVENDQPTLGGDEEKALEALALRALEVLEAQEHVPESSTHDQVTLKGDEESYEPIEAQDNVPGSSTQAQEKLSATTSKASRRASEQPPAPTWIRSRPIKKPRRLIEQWGEKPGPGSASQAALKKETQPEASVPAVGDEEESHEPTEAQDHAPESSTQVEEKPSATTSKARGKASEQPSAPAQTSTRTIRKSHRLIKQRGEEPGSESHEPIEVQDDVPESSTQAQEKPSATTSKARGKAPEQPPAPTRTSTRTIKKTYRLIEQLSDQASPGPQAKQKKETQPEASVPAGRAGKAPSNRQGRSDKKSL
ncbi:hypothetical protein CONLIGDRAFT_424789 [Coniochaeta ligniaria NRRL 30616]|uniref:Uncharacterized protein n=1 Tax=Coniochaeta ligniaria NRRL 30616 TaxID=1408157 RepID=A0A1J7IIP0_9PEZI|nr:hypothetical protein CONLIGDRAFT_424789 [Coniochaeta ligniaria NRRL 30616]